jgi:multiple sugar transport system permease protein
MGVFHVGLLLLAATFIWLYFRSRQTATRYARVTLLVMAACAVLAPFAWLFAAVFKDSAVLNEYIFFPPLGKWSRETMNLGNFHELFKGRPTPRGTIYFWEFVLNSTVFATVTTTFQIVFSSMAGYALAKYEFRGKGALTLFMLGSMTIPSALLLAPLYKMIVDLGLVDSLPGLILPLLVSSYGILGIFLFRQACLGVPNEMIDAARLDGCGELGIYFRLVMPLVRPIAAAYCLVAFLANWNAFFTPNVFLHSDDNLTLPVVLNLYLGEFRRHQGVFLTGTALAMIPPAILFFALQKEFISGLTSGAVKG